MDNRTLEYGEAVVQFMAKPWFLKTVTAIIILLVGLVIAKIVSKLIEKGLKEIEIDEMIKKVTGLEVKPTKYITKFTLYFIIFIAVTMALNELSITTTVLHFLAGAIIVLIVVSVLLGIRDFIPNSIAGFRLLRRKTIEVGETINVKDIQGKVTKITLNETTLRTEKGDDIIIPNASIIKSEIKKIHKD